MSQSDPARSNAVAVPCPVCGKPSDSIKCYRLGTIVFLVLAVWSRMGNVVACPACMRKKVFEFAGTNLFTTHIAWPLVIMPVSIGYLVASTTKGHSRAVRAQLGLQLEALAALQAEQPEVVAHRRPVVGTFRLIVGAGVALFAATVMASQWTKPWRELIWLWAALASVVVGIAAAMVWSGICNLRSRRASWSSWFIVAGAGLLLFLLTSPLVARAYWTFEGRRLAAEHDWETYFHTVRPEFWQVGAAREVVDWQIDYARRKRGTHSQRELEKLLADLESRQSSNLAFGDLADEVRRALADQADPDEVGSMDDFGPGGDAFVDDSKDDEEPVSDPVDYDTKDSDRKE